MLITLAATRSYIFTACSEGKNTVVLITLAATL